MSTTTPPASAAPLRVLFCIGVLPANFEADSATLRRLLDVLKEVFGNLKERFDIDVLGTMDDDKLMVGPSTAFPWTSYILADVPDLDTVAAVTNLLRVTEVDGYRLWRYLRIEARVGRPLFFGNA